MQTTRKQKKKNLHFFTILYTISNLLSLPILQAKLQYLYLPATMSSFSSMTMILVTSDTCNYTYSPKIK